MKKFFVLLSFVFLLFFSRQVFAVPSQPTPAPLPSPTPVNLLGVDPSGQNGPNPAPPIGFTVCGKTMCNKDEVCTKYPQDIDEHCVPKDKIPLPDVPEQKLPAGLELCPKGQGTFPPNSACVNNFKSTQEKIGEYQKTCIYEPVVKYESERWAISSDEEKDQPYVKCGKGYAGPEPAPRAPGTIDKYFCSVNMLVYTDVRDAELGSYGPDQAIIDQKSTDFAAQNYLYNALFGKPMDLTTKTAFSQSDDNPNNNREAYRTYWRLLSASTQANLKSYVLNMANNDQINNTHFKYTDTNGKGDETDFKSLYSVLKNQVILFLHFPFVRVGCLTDYPVCPEYAQAIKELKPLTQSLTDYLTILEPLLPAGVSSVTSGAITTYEAALKLFGKDVDGPYNAFVPLDFDSLRSYVVMKPTPDELAIYTYLNYRKTMLTDQPNAGRNKTNKPNLANVSRENIPYMGAIYQGLLSPKFGILASLQPSWLLDTYATPGGILSDYKRGNASTDFPEAKLAKQGWLSFLADEIGKSPLEILNDGLAKAIKSIKDLFTKQEDIKLKGYTKNDEDLRKDIIKNAYVNFAECPLPVSYHLISPKTAAQLSPDVPGESPYSDHHQVVTIWGPQVAWSWDPKKDTQCGGVNGSPRSGGGGGGGGNGRGFQPQNSLGSKKNQGPVDDGLCWCEPWPYTDTTYPDQGGNPCINYTRHWTVSGTEHGKALTVLNNPKATDIKNAVVQNSKFSLYKTLIPDAFNKKKITDASVDAPYAANYNSYYQSVSGGGKVPGGGQSRPEIKSGTATAPNGNSVVLNEVEPINRINNRAQDTMHLLQNCWTVPDGQQNSPRCKIALAESASESGACKGDAFSKISGEFTEPSSKAQAMWGEIESNLNANTELVAAYTEAEKQTGVPCEVLAGIHYEEADNDPNKDLQSGADLGGRTLTDSAIQAAKELLGKAGTKIDDINTLIKALSWYNGGGNSNCQASGSNNCPYTANDRCGETVACATDEKACTCAAGGTPDSCRAKCPNGFPFQFSYSYCPPQGTGYDDPYVTNWWKSPENDNMYLLYKYDCTPTKPQIHERPGSLTVAIMYYLSHKK